MKEIESLIADESFQRWVAGEALPEERENWHAWVHADMRHRQLCDEAKKLWNEIRFESEEIPDMEAELSSLLNRIHAGTPADATASGNGTPAEAPRQRRRWLRPLALAASLFGIIFLAWNSELFRLFRDTPAVEVITTQFGERSTLAVADEVRVVLNADSRLQHWQERSVHYFRLDGEAYFDFRPAQKNTHPRLIVTTGDGEVRVHGTKFSVYKRREHTRVVVEEGRVEVRIPAETDSLQAGVYLNAGELLAFTGADRSLQPQRVNALVYTSWSGDKLIFDNTPFSEIARRLQETYAVTIEVGDSSLLSRTLSGSVENGSLNVIIEALARVLHTRVVYQGDKIILMGAER